MPQNDSPQKLSPQAEAYKVYLDNKDKGEEALTEALKSNLREKSKNPPPMPPKRRR